MKKETVKKSKLKVVNEAMKNAQASDLENIEKFYEMLIEHKQEEIKDKEHELSTQELNHTRKISKLKKELEDAMKAETEAISTIDVELIKTNADRSSFILVYQTRLNNKRQAVDTLISTIDTEEETFEIEKRKTSEEIEELRNVISNITEPEK